jgi:hypothetical protein
LHRKLLWAGGGTLLCFHSGIKVRSGTRQRADGALPQTPEFAESSEWLRRKRPFPRARFQQREPISPPGPLWLLSRRTLFAPAAGRTGDIGREADGQSAQAHPIRSCRNGFHRTCEWLFPPCLWRQRPDPLSDGFYGIICRMLRRRCPPRSEVSRFCVNVQKMKLV